MSSVQVPGLVGLSLTQNMELLDASEWTDDLMQNQIEILAVFFKPYLAPTDTIILKEGQQTGFFCLLCEGLVDVVKESSTGKVKKLQTFGPGKTFGEMAFFDHGPSSASVIVKEKATILIMTQHDFESLSMEAPYLALIVAIKLFRDMSFRLRETSGKLIDFL